DLSQQDSSDRRRAAVSSLRQNGLLSTCVGAATMGAADSTSRPKANSQGDSTQIEPGAMAFDRMRFCKEQAMSNVVYVSRAHIERREGPPRIAHLPGESKPVIFSHGAIAEHYKIGPAKLKESHSSTIDYVISATA